MGVAWADGGDRRAHVYLAQPVVAACAPYDKRADIHEAFLSLGCALICWQSLRKTWTTG
jgi:hypothetical protein